MYLTDSYYYDVVRKVTASTGIITTIAGSADASGTNEDGDQATSATFSHIYGIALDMSGWWTFTDYLLLMAYFFFSGNVYIADFGDNRIRKVTVSTGIITTVASSGSEEFSGDGGQATSAGLDLPALVAVDLSGNMYISDYDNNRIRKVTASTGIIDTIAGSGASSFLGDEDTATSANLFYPYAVAVDSAGNIYIADTVNDRIRKVTKSTGIITTLAGTGSCEYSGDGGEATAATLCRPTGVALDSSGNVYIADCDNTRVRKVTASTSIITTFAGTDDYDYRGDGGPVTSAALNMPYGIALDSLGTTTICVSYLFTYI